MAEGLAGEIALCLAPDMQRERRRTVEEELLGMVVGHRDPDVRFQRRELGPDAVRLTDVEIRLGTQLAAQPFYSGDGRAALGVQAREAGRE